MTTLTEGQKVIVVNSKNGYKGPAILVGLAYGSKYLVKTPTGDIFTVEHTNLKPFEEVQQITGLSKEERKALKKKYKEERKNHLPSKGRGR